MQIVSKNDVIFLIKRYLKESDFACICGNALPKALVKPNTNPKTFC